jgi:hypothetical protein
MSDSAGLERRYGRLLALYPAAFRSEHEQEILAVLMAGADEGQQRPRTAEAANLIKHALWISARPISRDELRGPFRISVLRGVNYWPRTALVNGAGTGLVEIKLDRQKWVWLGPLRAPLRRLIVSAEDQSGLVAALDPPTADSPSPADPSL